MGTSEKGKRRLIEQYCEIAYYLYKPQTSKLFCMGNVANGYIHMCTYRTVQGGEGTGPKDLIR